MNWFYGFKLHVVINHRGELLACQLTSGNTDDHHPVRKLAEHLWGRLFADKGYLSQPLTHVLLRTRRLRLVTHIKRIMANVCYCSRTRCYYGGGPSWKRCLTNSSTCCSSNPWAYPTPIRRTAFKRWQRR